MYDELVKSLRQCAEASCAGCKNDLVQIGCRGLLQHEAADAIEQLSAECDAYREAMTDEHNRAAKLAWEKEHRWIPVVERLPKDDTICILTDGVSEAIGYRGKVFGWHLIWTDYLAESDITHWMPLPSTEGLNET